MKIKKLMPIDGESRRLIDWMEKGPIINSTATVLLIALLLTCKIFSSFNFVFAGVYDALQKKYLKALLFSVCESVDGATIEEYACKAF